MHTGIDLGFSGADVYSWGSPPGCFATLSVYDVHMLNVLFVLQSVMLDIASMVYSIIGQNLPEFIRMSRLSDFMDMYFYSIAMFAIMWCVIGCLT